MSYSDPSPLPPDASPPSRQMGLPLPLGKLFWTYILLGSIIIIFIIEQTLPSFVNLILPYLPPEYAGLTAAHFQGNSGKSLILILMGGNFHPLIEEGQIWRFFTAMFLHADYYHLFFNAYALFIFGGEMERVYGRARFITIYVLTGLFGSLLSFAFSQAELSVGASGAIFGAVGMQVAYFYKHKTLLGESARGRLMNAGIIIAINLFYGFSAPNIDNLGHIGGLIAGICLGYGLAPVYEIIDRYTGQPRVVDKATLQSQLWVPLAAIGVLIAGTFVVLN